VIDGLSKSNYMLYHAPNRIPLSLDKYENYVSTWVAEEGITYICTETKKTSHMS